MYINPYCKTCLGDGVISSEPRQSGYLEEFLPCPDCRDKAMQDIVEVVKNRNIIHIPSAHPKPEK